MPYKEPQCQKNSLKKIFKELVFRSTQCLKAHYHTATPRAFFPPYIKKVTFTASDFTATFCQSTSTGLINPVHYLLNSNSPLWASWWAIRANPQTESCKTKPLSSAAWTDAMTLLNQSLVRMMMMNGRLKSLFSIHVLNVTETCSCASVPLFMC